MNKIAIYGSGGVVQGVRSNISSDVEIEVVDYDNDSQTADQRWDELQTELEFGNY